MQPAGIQLSIGDSVRFANPTQRAGEPAELVGEVAGINPGIATVDVMVNLGGRFAFLTKRPWELEKIGSDALPVSRSQSG